MTGPVAVPDLFYTGRFMPILRVRRSHVLIRWWAVWLSTNTASMLSQYLTGSRNPSLEEHPWRVLGQPGLRLASRPSASCVLVRLFYSGNHSECRPVSCGAAVDCRIASSGEHAAGWMTPRSPSKAARSLWAPRAALRAEC